MAVCRPSGFSVNGEISYPTPQKLPAAAYVCELTKVPGRFLPDKAMELGVPKGEMFAILKSGKSVTLENGSVVEAHLVSMWASPFRGWHAAKEDKSWEICFSRAPLSKSPMSAPKCNRRGVV